MIDLTLHNGQMLIFCCIALRFWNGHLRIRNWHLDQHFMLFDYRLVLREYFSVHSLGFDIFHENIISRYFCEENTNLQFSVFSDSIQIVTRGCWTKAENKCVKEKYQGIEAHVCACTTDKCNGAETHSVQKSMLVVMSALIFTFGKLFF